MAEPVTFLIVICNRILQYNIIYLLMEFPYFLWTLSIILNFIKCSMLETGICWASVRKERFVPNLAHYKG